MNKHAFLLYARQAALPACKLILIITAFLTTASLAQEATPVDIEVSSYTPLSTVTLGSGQDIEFQVYVRVEPERSANGVVLTVELPEGIAFSSLKTDGDICSYADNRVTCNMTYRPLKAGEVLIDYYNTLIQICVKPIRTGTVTLTARITANEPDPDPSNNTTTKAVTVLKSRSKRVRFF